MHGRVFGIVGARVVTSFWPGARGGASLSHPFPQKWNSGWLPMENTRGSGGCVSFTISDHRPYYTYSLQNFITNSNLEYFTFIKMYSLCDNPEHTHSINHSNPTSRSPSQLLIVASQCSHQLLQHSYIREDIWYLSFCVWHISLCILLKIKVFNFSLWLTLQYGYIKWFPYSCICC